MCLPFAALAATAAGSTGLGTLGTALSVGSSILGAFGSISKGISESNAASYNAQVATNNAKIAKQNAAYAAQEGEQREAMQQQKTRAEVAAIKSNQAASGVDVNSGSALDVRSSAAETGQLNAITLKSNAIRQAYGFQTEATNDMAQAALDKSEASADMFGGVIGGATSLIGGLGNAAMGYGNYMRNSSLTSSYGDVGTGTGGLY